MFGYSHSSNANLRRLSKDEVIAIAPSVLTVNPHESLSKRYSPISTLDIIDILAMSGWYPVHALEVKARKSNTQGFQKHMIKFQHASLQSTTERFESVLTNSHDGNSCYLFFLGILRLICSNGLMVGDTFDSIRLRHVGLEQSQVIDASQKMIEFIPQLAGQIEEMKKIELSPAEKNIYAESAKMLMFPKIEQKEEIPVDNYQILRTRRPVDNANDLWTTYNTVQENMLKGGLHYKNPETKKRQSTRQVKAIDKNITLNRALWNLTDQMMKLKTAA